MNDRSTNGTLLIMLLIALSASVQERKTGLFEDSGDVGQVSKKGSVLHEAAKGTYTISGGGEIYLGQSHLLTSGSGTLTIGQGVTVGGYSSNIGESSPRIVGNNR